MEQDRSCALPGRSLESRTPGGSQGQGLRRRDVLGVRQLHFGEKRHVHEVRYVWKHNGVFGIHFVRAGRLSPT